jgi:hypothetical protein
MLKISKLTKLANTNPDCKDTMIKPTKLETLTDQILDSSIVGGITWISTLVATNGDLNINSFIIGFGLTFLIKMKEYRKIT